MTPHGTLSSKPSCGMAPWYLPAPYRNSKSGGIARAAIHFASYLNVDPDLDRHVWVAFFLIQLPPGDYVSFRILQLQSSGVQVSDQEAEALKAQFGLDKPPLLRYFQWVSGIVTRGNWGYSMQWTEAGQRNSGRARAHDGRHIPVCPVILLDCGDPDRDLFSHPPIFPGGLRIYLYWVYWGGHARLLAGVNHGLVLLYNL